MADHPHHPEPPMLGIAEASLLATARHTARLEMRSRRPRDTRPLGRRPTPPPRER
jgi:hypothetical protein